MKHKKSIFFGAAAIIVAANLTACGHLTENTAYVYTGTETDSAFAYKKEPVTVNAFKLDTIISISAYADIDEAYLEETLKLCDHYEDLFSMHKEGSALYRLNTGLTDKVPAELGIVISKALEYSAVSDGKFQISIGRVSELWDFTSGNDEIPDKETVADALKTVDDTKIRVYPANEDEYVVEKPSDTKIDLGAVAKGYIADRLKDDLLSRGIQSAVINLGGNVLCVGDKNGEPFNIGIRRPFADNDDILLTMKLKDCSVVSSGISERYFEKDGKIYHHILDPKTGYPYENGLWQTTIVSEDSFTGDIMSTLCYAVGTDDALKLCENDPETDIILVKDDLSLIKSDGIERFLQ